MFWASHMSNLNKQQTRILQILKTKGAYGMNSYEWRTEFIQLPARIKELRQMGYSIVVSNNKNRSVNYILASEPQKVKETIQPQEMVWVTGKDAQGYPVARQVPKYVTTEKQEPKQEGLF